MAIINPDIRWRQRFSNYQKALALLEGAADTIDLSVTERAGLIQFFEVTLELAWKTMKDIMEEQRISGLFGPKDVVKMAFSQGLIEDGHLWLKALDDRNLTAQTYHEETAVRIEANIRELYLPSFQSLRHELARRAGQ